SVLLCCMGTQTGYLASAEGDDASDRIVRRDADCHAVPWNHLDAEAAHTAAQLGENLVTLGALHAVQTAAVDRNHGALHIEQIMLAQLRAFPIKDCAISGAAPQTHPRALTASSSVRDSAA